MNSISNGEEDQEEWLSLSLSTVSRPPPPAPALPLHVQPVPVPFVALAPVPPFFPSPREPHQERFFLAPPYPPPPPPPPPSQLLDMPQIMPNNILPPQEDQDQAGPSRPVRARKLPVQAKRQGKSETITPPYPWATSRRATVYSIEDLLSKDISAISGAVQCKRCEKQFDIEYDLQEKFSEVANFIAQNMFTMHDRAPQEWMNPALPICKFCGQDNRAKPVITKKKTINWLFLFLGQMLGCCKLSQLKYFCKHTRNHRTGAKDRVLYLTYMDLCKQLDPNGPFHA